MPLHCSGNMVPHTERTDSKFGRFSQKCTKYTKQQFKIQFSIPNPQKSKKKYKNPCSVVNRRMVLTYGGGVSLSSGYLVDSNVRTTGVKG